MSDENVTMGTPKIIDPEPEDAVGYTFAKEITVDRDERGVPRITIDGERFRWFTNGIVVPAPSLNEMPTATITILADKVTMLNEDRYRRDEGAES
jgi:hypothetical protein